MGAPRALLTLLPFYPITPCDGHRTACAKLRLRQISTTHNYDSLINCRPMRLSLMSLAIIPGNIYVNF